jgi:ATP-dependent protease ClpP protease subunit
VSELSGDYLSAHNYAMIDRHNMQTMVDIYAEKCHKTGQYFKDRGDSLSKVKSYIKRKMKDGDWYLTAEESVHYGFADCLFSKSLKL